MKKLILLKIILFVLICSSTILVFANDNEPVKILIDGIQIESDVPSQIVNDRTMVPLRAIFQALGAVVRWDDSTQTVSATKQYTTITMQIGNTSMIKNGQSFNLDVGPMLVDGRTLVPVRAIAESFNCSVKYDDKNEMVIIERPSELDIPKNCYAIPGNGIATIFATEVSGEVTGYSIYCSLNEDGPYVKNSWTTGFGKDGVTIRNLTGMQTYYFKVRAEKIIYNSNYDSYETLYSNFSAPFMVKPANAIEVDVAAPKITNAIVNGTNVTLMWDLDSTIDEYVVYIDGINAFDYVDNLYGDSYVFTDLNENTEYSFSLIAIKKVSGQSYSSDFSNTFKVKTGQKTNVILPNVTIRNIKQKMDSVGGITYTFDINNNCDKTVKYVTVKWNVYNSVGDKIYDTISGESFSGVVTGPINPGKSLENLQNERKFYNSSAKNGSINQVTLDVEYMDGTKETIPYNRAWMQ